MGCGNHVAVLFQALVDRYSSASFQRVQPANMVSCCLVSFWLESRRCPCSAFHAVSAQTIRRVVLHCTPEVRLYRIVRFWKIHIIGSRQSCRRSVSGSCPDVEFKTLPGCSEAEVLFADLALGGVRVNSCLFPTPLCISLGAPLSFSCVQGNVVVMSEYSTGLQ